MKKIQLGHHLAWWKYKYPIMWAIVDDEDYDNLNQYKWSAQYDPALNKFYAFRTTRGDRKCIKMHAIIIGTPIGMHTDHRDGNTLNNQKINLRVCTPSQNCANIGLRKNNTSGKKGVSWNKKHNRWHARIMKNRKQINIGYFQIKQKAVNAYNKMSIKINKEFSNF